MLLRDLAFAVRTLRHSPVFTLTAALTIALAIGANTTIFSLINSVLLRTLPVTEPQRLVTISSQTAIDLGFRAGAGWNSAMWDRFRPHADNFAGAFAWLTQRVDLSEGGEVQPANGLLASGELFTTLGVPPLLGRTFTSADEDAAEPVAVIGYGLWQRRFGGAAGVLQSSITIDGTPRRIIGVMPSSFIGIEIGQMFDVALPLRSERVIRGPQSAISSPRSLFLAVMLRLRPGQSLHEATAAMRAAQPDILGTTPPPPPILSEPFVLVPAATGTSDRSRLRQQYERPLFMTAGIVGLVLMIACVNIANLLLARAAARRYELSVRLALGAPRWRLTRQLLIESAVLAGLGAVLGLVFAVWASHALVGQLSTSVSPVFLDLALDWRVMTFTAMLTVTTVLLFGTVPAFRAARVAPAEALLSSTVVGSTPARSWPASRIVILRRMGLSDALVIAQLALSMVLVFGAGLFVRTFTQLANVPLGFDRDRVLLVDVDTARAQIDPTQRHALYERLVARVRTAPGVAQTAASMWSPGGGGGAGLIRDARGRAVNAERQVVTNFVTSGWFTTYGVPRLAGRDFTDGDTAGAAPVAVVNETFARKFYPDQSVVGEILSEPTGRASDARAIVGIVGDAIYGSLRDSAPPTVYLPLAQSAGQEPPGRRNIIIGVRPIAGDPASVTPSIALALSSVDPHLAFSFRPIADQVNASLRHERLLAALSGFFGGLALLLAALGLYGVTAYSVVTRRKEIGIRLALGAQPIGVQRFVIHRALVLVGAGIGIGAFACLSLSRVVSSLLFGLDARDPLTMVTATFTLVVAGLSAAWLPAFRASTIDPAAVLRND